MSVQLTNACGSERCCTLIWCHSGNTNNCFDVRYSVAVTAPPSAPNAPLSGGALAGLIIGVLLLVCCLSACGVFAKRASDAGSSQQTTTYVVANPSAASGGVQAWGSAEAHKPAQQYPAYAPQAPQAAPAHQPQAAPPHQPQGFAPQVYPVATGPAAPPRHQPQQPANSFTPQPAPFIPDSN